MPKQWPDILLPSNILIDPLVYQDVRAGLAVGFITCRALGHSGRLRRGPGHPVVMLLLTPPARADRPLAPCSSSLSRERAKAPVPVSGPCWLPEVAGAKHRGCRSRRGIAARNRAGLRGTARTVPAFWCWCRERKGR